MTKNNNTDYKKRIEDQRSRRRKQLSLDFVILLVVIVFLCALGQGNLRKHAESQTSFRPEGGTSADIVDIDLNTVKAAPYVQYVNYMSPDLYQKADDQYRDDIYSPANVTDDRYFDTALFIGDSRAETLWLYSDVTGWDICTSKDLNVETALSSKIINCNSGEYGTVLQRIEEVSYDNIYISFGFEELGWYNERFISDYRDLLDRITELSPSSNIYVMSILPVSAELSSQDFVYNNPGVDRLNSLLVDMCKEYDNVIYLDIAGGVAENGVLPSDVGTDGIHYDKAYCCRIMDYIRSNVYVRK